jgi:hypothetical protein
MNSNLFQEVNYHKIQETPKSTLVSTLFILLLIIGGNFLAPLFPCSIQRYFTNNMLPKHVLGFLTLYFFVELLSKNEESTLTGSLKESVGLYIWFLFASKMDKPYFLLLILTLLSMYSLKLYIDQEKNNVNKINTEMIIEKKVESITNLNKIEDLLFYIALIITLYGSYSYYTKKNLEYKKDFNLKLFVFGKPSCKSG